MRDTQGRPLVGVKIDVWETDSRGAYDVQYANRAEPDGRAVLKSDSDGAFWFKAIVPVPYAIPSDGPVGQMLKKLGRHPWRPSHMHFMFSKPGFDTLITALYIRGSAYETSDAVFGVKESLITRLSTVSAVQAATFGVSEGTKLLTHDFVLATEDETKDLKENEARKAMEALGRRMRIVDGLPVPEVD